jgi:hypothetical protein
MAGLNLDDLRRFLQTESQAQRGDITSPGGTATASGPFRRDTNIALAPGQETIFNRLTRARQGAAGAAAGLVGGLDLGGVDVSGVNALAGEGGTADAERAVFQRGINLLSPQFTEESRALQQNLTDRGIPATSEQGRRLLDDLSRRQGAARENLALSSVHAGGQEASRRLAGALSAGQFGMANQQLGLGQLGQLLGLSQFETPVVPGLAQLNTSTAQAASGRPSTGAFEPGGLGRELLLGGVTGASNFASAFPWGA